MPLMNTRRRSRYLKPEPIHQKPALKREVQLQAMAASVEDRKRLEPPSIVLTTLAGHFHASEVLCSDAA